MTGAVVASLTGVTHRYGKRLALDAVDLDIPAGCMAGLIGPDGVGKSTLLGLVSGVRRLQSGTLRVLDADLTQRAVRRAVSPRIAYMPQGLGRNLYPTLSVNENIDFFGRLFGQTAAERRIRITELLEATGLAPFRERPAGKLSGGMKQKLGLCCALIHDPDLLILDEPTTGVDPLSRRQFWELIAVIRARRPGMSVLVATAYMEEADRFDWLAAMDDGKVIAQGKPADICAQVGQVELEEAFIALLPEEKRMAHSAVHLPPRLVDPDETPAISATSLTRRFGDFTAVDNVSFEIAKGEIFGFLGSNGCGKSTTMKMLTGLLEASEGASRLFGTPLNAGDMETRRHVGYMSQSFSLYSELTVRQNLLLHARLFHVPHAEIAARIEEMLTRFDLRDEADDYSDRLPLGIRQRLQLAVAVIHRPAVLILDEPTSGVDPIARDAFWQVLIDLSRKDGVTIFISTHFMNEALRCDRISLMHAGKVLAVGTPSALVESRQADTLEAAFIAYLEDAVVPDLTTGQRPDTQITAPPVHAPTWMAHRAVPGLGRLWAYARRETVELLRDRIRLFFALAGPVFLMLVIGFSISFDVDGLRYAVFDQDKTPDSRLLAEQFGSVRYFEERDEIASAAEMNRRFINGELTIAIEIPSGFGRDLTAGRQPELSVWVSGSMPFRAETAQGYIGGLAARYGAIYAKEHGLPATQPLGFEVRFLFNQAFKSAYALVPSILMLILMLIPAINATIGVVREKETGSIANFQSTPVTKLEFLLGKQLPYAAVGLISALMLFALGIFVFQVPFKGSLSAFAVGTVVFVMVSTAFGLVFSSFTRTQVAAVFATAIFSSIPAINFSGLLVPVSSLDGVSQVVGLSFAPAWYQPIAMGSFTKAHGWADLGPNIAALVGFFIAYMAISVLALRKQEA